MPAHRIVPLLFAIGFSSVFGALPESDQISLQQIATDLADPVAITHAGDGTGRLFIVEQAGRIRIHDGVLRDAPFLDISDLVSSGGERGLLSVAFHPAYETNGLFYVFYTNPEGDLVVARYSVSSDPNVADPEGAILLTIPHPNYSNHNGGQLAFGPDGYLYIGTGDGGGGGDPFGNAQNLKVMLGKILRIDVDGEAPYAIPPDNPFSGGEAAPFAGDESAAKAEIWAYGLRNPWRFSFDRVTGDLFIGDVGQGCWEEVDRQPASSPGGENYGWSVMEGDRCYEPSSCTPPRTCVEPSFTSPILVYSHADPTDCAITGGVVYRNASLPALAGSYLYADYCSGKLWAASPSAGIWSSRLLLNTTLNVTTFGEDESGQVYVADGPGGTIHRITAPAALPFSDDFEDGDASDWIVNDGEWSVVDGWLASVPASRAETLAPYGGCSLCTMTAEVRIDTAGGRVSLLGWYVDHRNYVELRLSDKKDELTLRRVVDGRVSMKTRAPLSVSAGVDYGVTLECDGTEIRASVDNGVSTVLPLPRGVPQSGAVGFRVGGSGKGKPAGAFGRISVN